VQCSAGVWYLFYYRHGSAFYTYFNMYNAAMIFTWHEPKRESNLQKHGLDFVRAEQVFAGPTLTVEDVRDYDGEQRFMTTGFLDTAIVTICHTETDEYIRIISMRKAEHHEIELLVRHL